MQVGGPKSVTDAVKAAKGSVGPRSKWLGSWGIKSGIADWDAFFQGCKADGIQPLVISFLWGDFISPAAITNGVQDTQQGVWKTAKTLLPLLRGVMQKAKAAGVSPLVALDVEFNQHGCEASQVYASWYDDCAATIRAECPAAKIIFTPGNWGDLHGLVAYYAPQVAKADYVGLQAVLFAPRHGKDAIASTGNRLAKGFAAMASAKKPVILYDVALSTYGGSYASAHPFSGGDGKALEADQAAGLNSLAIIPNLDTMVYRDLKDNSTFSTANYGGLAERFVGVVRSDGTPKPGMASLIALAAPTAPSPAGPSIADLQAEIDSLKAALKARDASYEKLKADLRFVLDDST